MVDDRSFGHLYAFTVYGPNKKRFRIQGRRGPRFIKGLAPLTEGGPGSSAAKGAAAKPYQACPTPTRPPTDEGIEGDEADGEMKDGVGCEIDEGLDPSQKGRWPWHGDVYDKGYEYSRREMGDALDEKRPPVPRRHEKAQQGHIPNLDRGIDAGHRAGDHNAGGEIWDIALTSEQLVDKNAVDDPGQGDTD
jgi:hypothetical protein